MTTEENKEDMKKPVIAFGDCQAAIDFFSHFEIPLPSDLNLALENFRSAETLENQEELKFQLCKAIATIDHEAFKDEMFEKIVAECKNVVYEMQFDKDLETTLTDDKKTV
jgi:hypothetical protein